MVKGQSIYYIANDGEKDILFNAVKNSMIARFYKIYPEGLVRGTSNFFLAMEDVDGKWKKAIFNMNGGRITEWADEIDAIEFLEGKSPYVSIENNGKKLTLKIGK